MTNIEENNSDSETNQGITTMMNLIKSMILKKEYNQLIIFHFENWYGISQMLSEDNYREYNLYI
jgi:hypothetical protein